MNSISKFISSLNCTKVCTYFLCLVAATITQVSCRKFVDIDTPSGNISQQNIYSNDKTATTVLTFLFDYTMGANISLYGGLLADEFVLLDGSTDALRGYYSNNLVSTPNSSLGREYWELCYTSVYRCNAAIEGLTASSSLTSSVKLQLLGEAHFMRAWFNFYLVNLYGAVPLPVSTDAETNSQLPRSPVKNVYELIVSDLLKAQELLNTSFIDGALKPYSSNVERVRPTYWAATAMLARVYLFTNEYSKAETEATKVIGHSELFELVPYTSVFLKNSSEAIWQTQPAEIGWNSVEGRIFNLGADPVGFDHNRSVHLSRFLLSAFEPGDQRRVLWVDSLKLGDDTYYYPVKYKIGGENAAVKSVSDLTEYSMMLRLGEQYLIRSESRTLQGNLAGAISDLDVIRNRAGLPLIANKNPGISQIELIQLIQHERQVEFFTEWGHRWFDLKRSGQLDARMNIVTPQKGGNWESTDQLLPVPYKELLLNRNLSQNPGY